MCLTIPGRVLKIQEMEGGTRMAEVDLGVALRSANLIFTPEVRVGDFVIVQAGFATRRLDEKEAQEALAHHAALAERSSEPSSPSSAPTGSP